MKQYEYKRLLKIYSSYISDLNKEGKDGWCVADVEKSEFLLVREIPQVERIEKERVARLEALRTEIEEFKANVYKAEKPRVRRIRR